MAWSVCATGRRPTMSAVIPNTDLLHHLASLKRAEVARLQSAMAFSELEASRVERGVASELLHGRDSACWGLGRGWGVDHRGRFTQVGVGGVASAGVRRIPGEPGGARDACKTIFTGGGERDLGADGRGASGRQSGDLRVVKEATDLPVLRRDLIVDPWQIWESRAAGADAVILTSEILPEGSCSTC